MPYSKISTNIICSPEHRALALKAAQQAIVLLVNRNDFRPLNKAKLKKIAVIGPHGDTFTPGGHSGKAAKGSSRPEGYPRSAAIPWP
jgi:beta-glucosidase